MNLTHLRLSEFKQIEKLLVRKENLMQDIAAIDRELSSLDSGSNGSGSNGRSSLQRSTGARRGRPPGSGRKSPARSVGRRKSTGRHGATKEAIIAVLKSAGKEGIHVKDIIKKTGFKDANVRMWFYVTGKKIKNVKQVARATYTWVE